MPLDPAPTTAIKLSAIAESPTNPRRTYGKQSLQELADSIRLDGVLQPLLVRPLHGFISHAVHYEVVFGHRRLRAAKLAGLSTVPCMVRELSDDVAARLQVVENLQREDLHPLEEAEGLHQLRATHGMGIKEIEQHAGKSKSYIYARVKLLALDEPARKAFYAGEIDAEVAKHIATIPPGKEQEHALAIATERTHNGERKSFRVFMDELEDAFNLNLNQAPWRLDDATLLADRPSCMECGERSGKVPELYGEIIKPGRKYAKGNHGENVCRNRTCHNAKKKAYLDRVAAELEAKGKKVITGSKARAATVVNNSYMVSSEDRGKVKIKEGGAYVPLEAVRDELKKAQAKGAAIEPVVIVDPRSGKKLQAVAKADLQAAGVKVASEKKERNDTARNDRNAELEAYREEFAEQQEKLREQLWTAIAEKMLTSAKDLALPPGAVMMTRLLCAQVWHLDQRRMVPALLGLQKNADSAAVEKHLAARTPAVHLACAALAALTDQLLLDAWRSRYSGKLDVCTGLLAAAKEFSVPLPDGLLTEEKIPAPAKAEKPEKQPPAAKAPNLAQEIRAQAVTVVKEASKATKKPKAATPADLLTEQQTDAVLTPVRAWPFPDLTKTGKEAVS